MSIPIGLVAPYVGDEKNVPLGWILLDGSRFDENHDKVADALANNRVKKEDLEKLPFWGKQLPQCEGRVLCGQAGDEKVGGSYGEGRLPDHVHHGMRLTGKIAATGEDPGQSAYLIRDDKGKWTTGHHLAVHGGPSTIEGHHRHELLPSREVSESGPIDLPRIAVRYIMHIG